MPLYDATLPLKANMISFPGDPVFKMTPFLGREMGDPFDLAVLELGTHTGTHVDPPSHYLDGGATVDELALETLVGPAVVLDLRGWPEIGPEALSRSDFHGRPRVLLKTDNGQKLRNMTFDSSYVHLNEQGAQYLVEKGIQLVGVDYVSIERYENQGAPVHRILLQGGVVIVEAVDLLDIPAGPCEIYCLPLKITGGDGAPARVLLRTP